MSCPEGFRDIAECHNGVYDCEYVSPYSKSAHNLHSDILIWLHDWISDDVLSSPLIQDAIDFGRIPSLPTNKNHDRFLSDHFGFKISDTYATNLFPYIKPGGINSAIPVSLTRECARIFGLPHIEILQAKFVIALGLNCFKALVVEAGELRPTKLADAIGQPITYQKSRVRAQAHTGALGQNNRNSKKKGQTDQDWKRMAMWFQSAT